MCDRRRLGLLVVLFAVFVPLTARAVGLELVPDTTSPGNDTPVIVTDNCDGDGYMDSGENVHYKLRFRSTEALDSVDVTLTPKYSDCDSQGCPSGLSCLDPTSSNNPLVALAQMTVWNPAWHAGPIPSGTTFDVVFGISVKALPPAIDWVDMVVDWQYCRSVPHVCYAVTSVFPQVINADNGLVKYYSTDFPGGGPQDRDFDGNESVENPDQYGLNESVTWSDLTQGKDANGNPVSVNQGLVTPSPLIPWSFDQNDGGFRVGQAPGNSNTFITLANWGEDSNYDGVLQAQEDRDPFNFQLDNNWSTLGGCGYQTGTGAWHTGRISSPVPPTCMASGNNPAQCQRFETLPGFTGAGRWREVLRTPQVSKVDKTEGIVATTGPGAPCSAPLSRAEITNFAWNWQVDLPDKNASIDWEVDNDCATNAVDLVNDNVVLGSLTGPHGAVSGIVSPNADLALPLFAPLATCPATGRPCIREGDFSCPVACVWGTSDVNGGVGQNRSGRNACMFKANPIDPTLRGATGVAGPPDNDLDDDNDFPVPVVDENVAANGPLRTMNISWHGGPDLRIETLEDRLGAQTGACFQAALGFEVRESSGPAEALAGFGATVDDVVLEWRETPKQLHAAACQPTTTTPGEAKIVSAIKGPSAFAITITYLPACGATDHAVYMGACNDPTHWVKAKCSIGTSGTATLTAADLNILNPPPCVRYLVVGNDGFFEGKYGLDSANHNRPPWPEGCNLVQDLADACQ